MGVGACGESKETKTERYRKVAAERYPWAGPSGIGLAAENAQDYKTAFEQWKPLAEQGNADAQNFLANLYFAGHGVKKNSQEAMRWYRLAIAQNHAGAMVNMARIYQKGLGVPFDLNEAVRLYEKAAEHGHSWSALWLAEIYAQTDTHWAEVQAYTWYKIAEALSKTNSSNFLTQSDVEKLQRRMTPAQIEEAEELAHAWVEQHGRRETRKP